MAEPTIDSLELHTSSKLEDEAHDIQDNAVLTEKTHLLRRRLRLEVSSK